MQTWTGFRPETFRLNVFLEKPGAKNNADKLSVGATETSRGGGVGP